MLHIHIIFDIAYCANLMFWFCTNKCTQKFTNARFLMSWHGMLGLWSFNLINSRLLRSNGLRQQFSRNILFNISWWLRSHFPNSEIHQEALFIIVSGCFSWVNSCQWYCACFVIQNSVILCKQKWHGSKLKYTSISRHTLVFYFAFPLLHVDFGNCTFPNVYLIGGDWFKTPMTHTLVLLIAGMF